MADDVPLSSGRPRRIAIYGARGFAREVHQLIEDLAAAGEPVSCAGFLVDPDYFEETSVHNLPVFGDAGWLATDPGALVAIAIGATSPRCRIAHSIERTYGARFAAALRHPRAFTGRRVEIGAGSIVCAGASATTEIRLGRHVQLHANCTIGHDTEIGDFVTIAPGANISGRVAIGEGTFVGAGAVVINDIKIGAWSMVGAGAVVIKDIPDNVTVVGNPARIVSEQRPGWHLAGA